MSYQYNITKGFQRAKSKTKRIIISTTASVMMLGGAAGIAMAAPGDNGSGNGGCVDNFYGNATNPRESGHGVLPSQSPGPFVNTGFNEPPRNDRTRGLSIGDAQQLGHDAGFNGQETMDLICLAP